MFAPFTLVRSVIETASVVLWAMNGDTRERISKVLRFEYQGTKLAKDVYVTLDKEAAFSSRSTNSPEANELIRRQRDLIETLADGYGVRPELATYPTSTKMIEGAYESLNGTPMIYGWWQIASGAAHGKSWPASFLLADGDPSRPDDWKQGNFGNLMTMVQCAVGLTVSATDFRMRLGGVDARISDLV